MPRVTELSFFRYWFAFLPGLKPGTIKAANAGINDYARTFYVENEGDLGYFSAAEPFYNDNNP